jgi:hypothetical protein
MKRQYLLLIAMGALLGAILCLAYGSGIKIASASVDADDVGLIDDDTASWKVTWWDGGLNFKLRYVGFGCVQEVKAECISGSNVTPPKVGDYCELTGNQKWNCGPNKQELRWRETIITKCNAYLPFIKKCPPCPVCPEGIENCLNGCQ